MNIKFKVTNIKQKSKVVPIVIKNLNKLIVLFVGESCFNNYYND